ncbi:hypothetical protein V5268_004667 [Escherichia coli]|uniref:hypothetical protein n=1 Tax=Escherichia coli TaxID=562 RepID=UPI000A19F9E2|nr:hypothetical protein [Escherichia coli]
MTYRYPVDFIGPDHTNPVYHSGNMDVKKDGVVYSVSDGNMFLIFNYLNDLLVAEKRIDEQENSVSGYKR